MSDLLDYYSEWGVMKLEELEKLKAEREKLENASTIAPTDVAEYSTIYSGPLYATGTFGATAPGKCSFTISAPGLFKGLQRAVGEEVDDMDDEDDPVNPSHYQQGSIELIDFIDDWRLDFYQGSIVQYLLRWRQKGGVQDLEKALWYLKRYIDKEKGDV